MRRAEAYGLDPTKLGSSDVAVQATALGRVQDSNAAHNELRWAKEALDEAEHQSWSIPAGIFGIAAGGVAYGATFLLGELRGFKGVAAKLGVAAIGIGSAVAAYRLLNDKVKAPAIAEARAEVADEQADLERTDQRAIDFLGAARA